MDYELISPRDESASALVQVLMNRGFSKTEIVHYLNTTEADLVDPSTIEHIAEGAAMLHKHMDNNSKVFIQVDSDVDGYTSSSILMNYIHRINAEWVDNNWIYNLHDTKAHGIIPLDVPTDVNLVIIPDAGSEQFLEHKSLQDRGIDVLIIDHHNAAGYSPYACVINNQISNYPNKQLSGAGMIWKFINYLDSVWGYNLSEDYLDLAIFGIIADVMDVRTFENRQLIKMGTEKLHSPLLLELQAANSFQYGETVNIKTFSWSMAPAINAVARVGTLAEKQLIFTSMLEFKAYEEIPSTKRGCKGQMETRVVQAARTAKNVKARQDRLRDTDVAAIEDKIQDHLDNKFLIILRDNTTQEQRNITGLVANKLMSKYERPVLLLSKVIDEKDNSIHWAGSGRNGGSLTDSLQSFLKDTQLVDYAQGHDNAFGVSIPDENIQALRDYVNTLFIDTDLTKKYKVDIIYDGNKIDYADIATLADSDYLWGQGIDEPRVAIEKLSVIPSMVNLSPRGFLTIKTNSGVLLTMRGVSIDKFNKLYVPGGRVVINAVGTCMRQSWDNEVAIAMDEYEIIQSVDWYF